MTLFASVRQRWDIAPEVQTSLPFHDGLAKTNVRRIELACLLALMNDAIELAVRVRVPAQWFELVIATVFLGLSWWGRSWTKRAQVMLVGLFLIVVMLSTEWASFQLAEATGRIFSGYLTRVLTLTLLFVLTPLMLAMLLAGSLVSFGVMLSWTSLPAADQTAALISASIVSVISLVTGCLIYAGRRSDHEQKLLIQEQNAELDQLMAITAHDLRSPLLGLRNLFDLASRRAEAEPALPLRVMRDGIASLDAMLALVTRLLDAHHAEHAPLTTNVHDDVRTHLLAAAHRIAPLAEASNIQVDVKLATEPLCAKFDAGALSHILDNLIGNAVRYGPAGGRLYLTAAAVGDHAILAIEDRGPGIDAGTHAMMFGKFHRGASASASQKVGTGMGLFIASTFASRMGATLSYRPATPIGSIFELSLPIAPL